MPHRDRWSPDRERFERDYRDRDAERRRADFDRPEEDFGQADYSTDYAYDPRSRTGYRTYDDSIDRGDFGQADFSEDYAYDERRREPYRRSDPEARRQHEGDWHYADDDMRRDHDRNRRGGDWHYADERGDHDRRDERDDRDYGERREGRSWFDQARDSVQGFFGGATGGSAEDRAMRQRRRDRVIWAVITGRLDHERRLDARDIEVLVQGSEVILNGAVRSREEKRLAEDLADVNGVSHVQNNLRIRRSFWR